MSEKCNSDKTFRMTYNLKMSLFELNAEVIAEFCSKDNVCLLKEYITRRQTFEGIE